MRTLAAILVTAAAGCSSQLARGQVPASDVREVRGAAVTRCTRVGSVNARGGNGPSTADNEGVAVAGVRRKVANLGGNAFAITRRDVGLLSTLVEADAYRCPDWEPVRGLAPR